MIRATFLCSFETSKIRGKKQEMPFLIFLISNIENDTDCKAMGKLEHSFSLWRNKYLAIFTEITNVQSLIH